MIKAFAEEHRLSPRLDDHGTAIIAGKLGQIYDNEDGNLGVIHSSTRQKWGNLKRACLEAGMELHQDGEDEGSLLFDPKNGRQAKLAIKVSKCRVKRLMSPEQLARLFENTQRHRFAQKDTDVEAHSSAQNASEASK